MLKSSFRNTCWANQLLYCPDCNSDLQYVVVDDKEDKVYTHLLEVCSHCGYTKSYVEYEDE